MKKINLKMTTIVLVGFICLLGITSCGTLPTEESVDPNLTPIEIKQLAQEEMDKGSKRNALAYYEILLNRYGSDMSVRSAAEFEIAHIYIKQKKWEDANALLKKIITRYESAGGAGLVPKYYVLAKKDYAKTQEHVSKEITEEESLTEKESPKEEESKENPTEEKNKLTPGETEPAGK